MKQFLELKTTIFGMIILAMPGMLSAQSGDTPPLPPPNQSLLDLLKEGGWAMWPLGLCALVMFFLIFFCVMELRKSKFVPDPVLNAASAHLQNRSLQEATHTLETRPSVLTRVLVLALNKARPDHPDANKDKVEAAVVDALEGEENSIGQWVTYLNVVATVAPMIGLLGTVSGMIGAFSTIKLGGMGRPELLAGDIGEALITTATGLCIGIPAMIAYYVLRNRLNNLMLATVQTASLLIDYLAGEVELPEG